MGVEWEPTAVETARAAGHTVEHGDVREIDPMSLFCELIPEDVREFIKFLLQGSPPCQGLSLAGKGAGREDLEHLLEAVHALSQSSGLATTWDDAQAMIPGLMDTLAEMCSDDRSPLTFEVMRWIFALSPDFIMLEQVPAALPIWEAIGEVLTSWGYSVWAGFAHAEQFGVPQTRKRAMLLASATGKVEAPVPTHSKFHNRSPERLDEGVQKWVSMAEALSWGMTDRPYPTIAPGTGQGGPDSLAVGGSGARKVIYRENAEGRWIEQPADVMLCPTNLRPNAALRRLDQPAPTMAFGHETPRWVTPEELEEYRARVKAEVEPRVHNQSGTEFDLAWPADRPAPVIAGRDIVTMPGANANRFNGSTKSRNDGIRVQVWEAGVIQSFPADYPWQGTKTSKFQQVGNAVPPLLQQRLTEHLLGK